MVIIWLVSCGLQKLPFYWVPVICFKQPWSKTARAEQKKQPCLKKEMLRCFFFQLRAAMLFLFWLNSPTTSLAFGQWIVSFVFQHNHSGKQIELVSKRNTCCHWSLVVIVTRKKKATWEWGEKFFFSLDSFLQQSFFLFAWPGPFISYFFSSFCFFFAFFCQMSNLCEKKKETPIQI